MPNKRNLKQFLVYLRPKQIKSLNNLKSKIEENYDVKFPVAELIRDAIDHFINKTDNEEVLKDYIASKGF